MNNKIRAIAVVYNPHMAKMIALGAVIIALSLFLYGFFLLEAVAHTASRAGAERQIETLTSKVSALEQTYLAKTSSMTLEHAATLGFVPPAEVAIIYANAEAHTLSLNVRY